MTLAWIFVHTNTNTLVPFIGSEQIERRGVRKGAIDENGL